MAFAQWDDHVCGELLISPEPAIRQTQAGFASGDENLGAAGYNHKQER